MNYLVGMLCGGIMECPEFSFSDPFVIIKGASNKKEAIDFYNKKFHCDYFYGSCIGEIKDGKLFNISDDISKNKANSIFKNASEVEYYKIIRTNKYYFEGSRSSNYGCDIIFWDTLSDLKEVLGEKDDLYIYGTNDKGLSRVWNKKTCIGYTNYTGK